MNISSSAALQRPTRLGAGAWFLLLALYLATAFGLSIIQPLGRTPDEAAHMQYVRFLSQEKRLPLWQEQGGGEAGYEAQHPPLFYALAAGLYQLAAPLPENWRWQVLRWALISIGVALFFLCRRFFRALLVTETATLAATATVLLMPITILYTGYINPDGLVLLWTTLAFFLSWQAATRPTSWRGFALLGAVCGLAILTKLSGTPALCLAVWGALISPSPSPESRAPARNALMVLAAAIVVCGWWLARSFVLYGTPFIHTRGKLGTGLDLAAQTSFTNALFLTWRETFLSTWAQRGWFPSGPLEYAFYGIIIVLLALACVGLWRRGRTAPSESLNPSQPDAQHEANLSVALRMALVLLALIFAGQQMAFWTQDVEFNAGGRYLLAAIAGLALIVVSGVSAWPPLNRNPRARRILWTLWIGALMAMNLASAWNIDTNLNPKYAPDWEIFQFVPGEAPS